MYGVGPQALRSYDHFVFPGAVPRSFVGSLLLAALAYPFVAISQPLGLITSKFYIQMLVRSLLALVNAVGVCVLRRTVSRQCDRLSGAFFVLLSCTQFHLPFWMGRTLPNMFALFPVNLATALLLNRSGSPKASQRGAQAALGLMVFTAVVLRAEVALLLAPIAFQLLLIRQIKLFSLIKLGMLVGCLSITCTVLVDSYIWDQWPLWPELYGLYFNVYQGKSSEWVSPPGEYITKHVPKLALGSGPLTVVGFIIDARLRRLLYPVAVFIALISCLGHKEWRFVVYIVPWLNCSAAKAASWMCSSRHTSFKALAMRGVVAAILCANVVCLVALTYVSAINYPGGEALSMINRRFDSTQHVHVHISNFAAQTGATLFLQAHAPPVHYLSPRRPVDWVYNKTEGLTVADLSRGGFTHVIVEDWSPTLHAERDWQMVDTITGFGGVDFNSPHQNGWRRYMPAIRRPTQLWVLARRVQ